MLKKCVIALACTCALVMGIGLAGCQSGERDSTAALTAPDVTTESVGEVADPESNSDDSPQVSATGSGASLGTMITTLATNPTVSIVTSYPKVIVGSTSTVYVKVTAGAYQAMYCPTIKLVASGGFAVSPSSVTPGTIGSGSTKQMSFSVKAPSSAASGTLTAIVTWSGSSSCGGTIITQSTTASLGSGAAWTLKLTLNPGPLVCSDPATFSMTSTPETWRYGLVRQVSSPFVISVPVPPSPGTYSVSATWRAPVQVGWETICYPKGKTVKVTVTGSGQSVIVQ